MADTPGRFAVLGDGAMGTACALLLHGNGHRVSVWCPRDSNHATIVATRENPRHLPGIALPGELRFTRDFAEAVDGADGLVLAIPAVYLSGTLRPLAGDWPPAPIASVVKGIEQETFRTPSAMIAEAVPAGPVVSLSGPSHAEELARGKPASVVAAGAEEVAMAVQGWFTGDRFRVYTSPDLLGTELGGALKNVLAIAAGIGDGLEFGDNAKSALISRGLMEMVRFGTALGADEQTFYGLAGLGDLITTCVSPHGRNRKVGEMLGRGRTLEDILAGTAQVSEGVWTARSVHGLARREGIEMPVSDEVYRILFEGKDPRAAFEDLMSRDPKPERA